MTRESTAGRLRENEFWTPEPFWSGQRVFIFASGPSMNAETAERVRGRPTIVINSTSLIVPWADVLFFTDNGWFERHRHVVDDWSGRVITVSRAAKRALPDKILRVKSERGNDFPRLGAGVIREGRSSGHTAIAVAVALGAKEIVLLGYDMRLVAVDGALREHHHNDYADPGSKRDLTLYAADFVPKFAGWNASALSRGVKVWNATPDSALQEFEKAPLELLL